MMSTSINSNPVTLSMGEGGQLMTSTENSLSAMFNHLSTIGNREAKDDVKLNSAQQISDNLDMIINMTEYPNFLNRALNVFLPFLRDNSPYFIAEQHAHQVRKLILEIIQRLPANDHLKPHISLILSMAFKLLELENEENVAVCLKIIIELHKQFRPPHSHEITLFLQFVKKIYNNLPLHMDKIFEPREPLKVNDLSELNSESKIQKFLDDAFTMTPITTAKKSATDGNTQTYNLIPKAILSLKVLQELPIIVVLMYQLHKQYVHQEVSEFIPLIMKTITLQPSEAQRFHKNFNREVFVDFMGAQIKTLSFLAYIIRLYQEVVSIHATQMVKGILSLLTVCPHEVAHLRKELLIGARHILTTELRTKFVPHMEKLFDEDILLGKGWTTHESLRPLAYSTLADLVHHVRQSLPLSDLARAVALFSKNVHDESLPTSIQTMSCKLLLNLVECIKDRSHKENAISNGRELLMRMNEVFVQKFKTVAKLQLPVLMAKFKSQQPIAALPSTPTTTEPVKTEEVIKTEDTSIASTILSVDKKAKFGFPVSQAQNYTVADCRALVKTLVCGVKTITWGLTSTKPETPAGSASTTTTQFNPKETLVYIRMVKWAMEALDVYTLNTTPGQPGTQGLSSQPGSALGGPRAQPLQQTVRTKEEKEVLEHFAGALSLLNPQTFKEVFTQTIDFVVERIYKNYALQIMANSFLANSVPSPIFATILVEYLLERMHEMGSNMDRSNLYLKLFKLVFGSVSLFAAENEQMLKPHLHAIVNKSMDLSKSAKEPYNYFLLLRALFRSIGGGSHDLLYQEFLPLLPNLLQGLNSLQSGLHKQHMKDLFVELCLTVPVRLSSLLPYLPMLMDPLVSALNGSQTLVNQGLRTLELCVDNLQPDFLYEHIQPVRAELMQALWRTLRNPNDQIAHVAFRVLGKFGGGNRKMMIEPQSLDYRDSDDSAGPCLTINFPEHREPIALPVKKVIETAFNALKSSSTEPGFNRKQCWEVIKSYLVASLQLDEDKSTLLKLLTHPMFREGPINQPIGSQFKCPDKQARSVHQMAVTGMFVAAAIKELRQAVLPTMVNLVRHYTMVAISQQAGPFSMSAKQSKLSGMDPLVLIDAMAVIMGHEEKELCKPGHLAMVLILDTATNILGTKERACRLPIMETLAEKMCSLCYERAWYAKLGGCIAIKFLFERMDLRWVFQHQFNFLKALLFVMMDSTGEVSSGALDMAKSNLEKMLQLCATPLDETTAHLKDDQNSSLSQVIHELVRQVTSPNSFVREQAMNSLKILSEITKKPVTEVMAPHKDVLQDMIPPRKHLLRHQPVNAQIGLMDGNTFCTTLEPRLFTIDLKIMEHKVFFTELLSLCEADDASLQKLPCYKSITNLVPLRKSALRALAACHYIPECREKIFQVLFKALNNGNNELVEAGFECMKKFLAGHTMESEIVTNMARQLAQTVQDFRNININLLMRLNYLEQLFPGAFNDTKICEYLLSDLRKWLEQSIVAYKQHSQGNNKSVGQQQLAVAAEILKLYVQIQITIQVPQLIDMLCKLVLTTEKTMSMEPGSVLREPLMKALARFPTVAVEYLISENQSRDPKAARFMAFMVNHQSEEGGKIRDALKLNIDRMTNLLENAHNKLKLNPDDPHQNEIQFSCIRLARVLTKHDPTWIKDQLNLVKVLRAIWSHDGYHEKHHNHAEPAGRVDYSHWKEPKLIVKVLLQYFKQHQDTEILLLFQLLRALCRRFVADFQFLKDFLEHEVCAKFSVQWKRAAFFEFIKLWKLGDAALSQELKARILQYIIIPAYANSFEKADTDLIIGGPPSPETDSDDNVVSAFISHIIESGDTLPTSDAVRILVLQFSCLLVDEGAAHIHNAGNKKQEGTKLRKLMTYAWPCLLSKNCVDPATRYHGHLLLSHIIAKFAIHKRIVLQVFHSLLKAHAVEARNVVRQALEILTPSMPGRMEDGNTMLTHWTKKIILEEGHTGSQLVHILQLVVKHYKVYYPVRHHLIQNIVNSIQRLGFNATATIEQKKLAVDLCEIAIKWEVQRVMDENSSNGAESAAADLPTIGIKRPPVSDVLIEPARQRARISMADPNVGGTVSVATSGAAGSTSANMATTVGTPATTTTTDNRPLNKVHSDSIVNYLLRLACQVGEAGGQPGTASAGPTQGELLSRRCVALLKNALKPDIWGNCDLKLLAFDKILDGPQGVNSGAPNFANICTCLDLMSFLLTVLKAEQILPAFKPLQKAIAVCMRSNNSKVIRAVHTLMSRLMNLFPTEATHSPVASKHEELAQLYASVGTVIQEGLIKFEKNLQDPPASLFGTLMMLKAACISNSCYIDRLISSFMRVLQRLAKEHLQPTTQENTAAASELLILSLDLVKNRVAVMGQDIRKAFIGNILVGLIEKSSDVKVMKAITKMLEDWMKNKDVKMMNQGPNLKEKSILLVKMTPNVEKRFTDDADLNAQFLELINYVYRDENLKNTELTSKLEPAFLSGLRCTQPHIRAKFFEVFDSSMRKRLYDRLLYIVCSQNWESMGPHYWIKQCLELVMSTATDTTPVTNCSPMSHLPSVTSVINSGDLKERNAFSLLTTIKEEPVLAFHEEVDRPEAEDLSEIADDSDTKTSSLNQLIARQYKFQESARDHRTVQFLSAMSQLAHMDNGLAENLWLHFFPEVWKILSDKQRESLANEVVPFICSGAHIIQRDCHPSALNTFVEAVSRCRPPIEIKPALLKYLGKSHNLWHRSTLILERLALEGGGGSNNPEAMDALSEMYSLLKEEDMWAGLWQKKAEYQETNIAIAYEQQGYFEQAQGAYELAMSKYRNDYNNGASPTALQQEIKLWEEHWLRSCKELNQWEILLEYGTSKGVTNPFLVLESAWHKPAWALVKDALAQVEQGCPKEFAWKLHLYRGYLAICNPTEPDTVQQLQQIQPPQFNNVDRYVDIASTLCIKEWRRLPSVVSHIHLTYLQAAQQVMELHEAASIHKGLSHGLSNSHHDMKAIVKTWRNRLPVISDDLSHWSEIFTWRQHHYKFIASHYSKEQSAGTDQQASSHSMLGVHASAQAIIHFGKIARKHNLTSVCVESLSKIYTIASVPIVDCFQKIRQQVKCYVQTAVSLGKNELQEGLDVIESTNLKYFTKQMTAEFYALKGMLQAQIGKSEEANKAFSAAVQMHDTLVKAWALWGEYLESVFTKEQNAKARAIRYGVEAITCYLHACRHQDESKSRKYLAKVIWLLTYDDEKLALAEAVDKYNVGVPPNQWLPWIPQLLTCLVRNEGKLIINLLSNVGRMFPQAVYFPIRTLYLTLKIEQRERFKASGDMSSVASTVTERRSSDSPGQDSSSSNQSGPGQQQVVGGGVQGVGQPTVNEQGPIKATVPMWRCSRIMHMQRDLHPTVLSSLEGIVDQMVWFRENWYEEVLRQLRQGLAKCYVIAFDNTTGVSEATITPHTLNFVKKLVSTFGIGIENFSSSGSSTYSATNAANESLVRRAQASQQDPVFQKMKSEFSSSFDFTVPGAMKLQNLIQKLKKWIKILEAKTRTLPKSFLIEEKCRFLSNFSRQTAEVELPGELLLPKHNHYQVCVQRFMPRVEIVQKHNAAARRLYIRGHNGKIYPYLVISDSGLADARREERVLQLIRMMNHMLGKHKETSKRFLNFTVPRVVAVSPQMRLVEDNPSSISLLDIYKNRCQKQGLDHDNPIARYYEKLANVQARGGQASQQVLREILKEVQNGHHGQNSMVPKTMLKEWATQSFVTATDYWTFRKMFTLQLALAAFAEYVLHLSRLNPDMMYIHQDSGLINISYFKFDVDDVSGKLDSNRPVPFRMTPNITEFVTPVGVSGPLTASMISAARCFVQPSFKIASILRAVLRDEMIAWNKKNGGANANTTSATASNSPDVAPANNIDQENRDKELIISLVTKAVTTITQRLTSLSSFDGVDSKVGTLVATAKSHDNLCRMDPAWHPWL